MAIEELCIGRGDVRSRLKNSVLTLLPLSEKDFPLKLRKDFHWIITESTKCKAENPEFRGTLDETMRRIKNSTGEKIAIRIFKLYSDIQDIRGFPLLDFRDPRE